MAALSRIGLFRLVVSPTAPTSNQALTVWLKPNLPSWTGEGTVFLWDVVTATYLPATPGLWNAVLDADTTTVVYVTLTAPGPYAARPFDDVIFVKQTIGAPLTVNVDWSVRTKPLTIVDAKGDALNNNISITPALGQTQMALLNYTYIIDSNGASITLRPLPDGSGGY